MKKLIFVQACPDSSCFWWQTAVQLHNFRKFGYSKDYHALIFLPEDRKKDGFSGKWRFLQSKFPEATFHYITDDDGVIDTANMVNYIPLLRPYSLMKFFEKNPQFSEAAVFYCDSDILFTRPLKISQDAINDDVNYLSYTGKRYYDSTKPDYNYMCHEHFLDKENNIRDDRKEAYKQKDSILKKMTSYFGVEEQFFIDHKHQIGGAQYLLKNVNAEFFKKVYDGCIVIRTLLSMANQELMKGETKQEREDNGWQSWCADMWSIQLTLWGEGKEIFCPNEMDFCWATDKVEDWDKNTIYHDAGGTAKPIIDGDGKEHLLFHKKGPLVDKKPSYMLGWDDENLRSPFTDDLSFVSPAYCSIKYVNEINETKKFLMG